ncbi:MAG: endonuclease domain-containing protein [Moraxellaceae bacterium]|nr:endonuclease domain-containing protein [Moraxellaceae bacterium]
MRYIVDFYCHERRLVVELDGGQHLQQLEYDHIRTQFLQAQGLTVLRFWNNDILTNIVGVLQVGVPNFQGEDKGIFGEQPP